MELILALVISGYIVFKISQRQTQKIQETRVKDSIEWALSTVRPLTVESVNGVNIWYDLQTDQYIAQGQTLEDLGAALKRLNTKKVYMLGDYVFTQPDYEPILVEGAGEIEVIYR